MHEEAAVYMMRERPKWRANRLWRRISERVKKVEVLNWTSEVITVDVDTRYFPAGTK